MCASKLVERIAKSTSRTYSRRQCLWNTSSMKMLCDWLEFLLIRVENDVIFIWQKTSQRFWTRLSDQEQNAEIILPYMDRGDLRAYLRDEKNDISYPQARFQLHLPNWYSTVEFLLLIQTRIKPIQSGEICPYGCKWHAVSGAKKCYSSWFGCKKLLAGNFYRSARSEKNQTSNFRFWSVKASRLKLWRKSLPVSFIVRLGWFWIDFLLKAKFNNFQSPIETNKTALEVAGARSFAETRV